MQLSELMTKDVHRIEADATVQAAAEQMANLDIGALPVSDGDELVGVITDRDITIRTVAKGLDPKEASVRGTMTAEIESIAGSTSIEEAVDTMTDKQIRRLIVTDESGSLQGIVSLGDLATKCRDKGASAEALKAVSQQAPNA